MRIKSFFAASVEAALAEARREFGPDAMLVQSRPSPAEARALGDYEVVCALLPANATESRSAEAARHAGQGGGSFSDVQRLTQELNALRETVARLQSAIATNQISSIRTPPQFQAVHRRLAAAEVDSELIGEVLARAAAELSDNPPFTPEQLVKRQITSMLETDASVGAEQTTIALVGPPGAGKTACIAKLAARCGVSVRRTAEIIAVDEHRVAANEQLRAYAAVLGVGFRLVAQNADLGRALEECRRKSLLLIDTPGFSFGETDARDDLAAALRAHVALQVQLVLPCSMSGGDLRRAAEFYEPFGARRLIFTRLDETGAIGHIVNESVRQRKPVSFLATGPTIPDDIEAATADRLAELILQPRTAPLWAAAAAV